MLGGATATRVSAGNSHTCAVLTDGSARCWGYNVYGQLGDGTTTNRSSPAAVDLGGAMATQVSAGRDHTCALLTDGSVRCWGYNGSGQLGDGTMTNRSSPVEVALGTATVTATQVSAGYDHTCAVLTDGSVRCWGYNFYGQLGDGTMTQSSSPVEVDLGGATATRVSVGNSHTCAVLTGGSVRCWGYNFYGQLGDGTTTQSASPMEVDLGGAMATRVSAGRDHTCALLTDGSVRCWGYNGAGQLGDGTTTQSASPVAVLGVSDATELSAGADHTCVVSASRSALCWGRDGAGQLGRGILRTVGGLP